MILAKKITYKEEKEGLPPEIIDLGNVGEIVFFEQEIIKLLGQSDFIPVIAPIGVGEKGETYNINADLVASEIAIGLNAEKLVLLTDIDGVKNKDGSRLNSISSGESEKFIKEGIISGGMIPKIEWAVKAVNNGVRKAHILDGRVLHAVLLEMFTDAGIGTEIVP
jgi:acetylglutamate kinase